MATLYVTKTGNDSTGNGTVGTPYLTIAKALSVSTSGGFVSIGPGTYQETSGSGYLTLNSSFGTAVTLFSSTGINTDVTIQSASGTTADMLLSGSGYTFLNLSFTSRANTVPIVVRFNSITTNITFTNCLFNVASSNTVTNSCVSSSFAASTTNGTFLFDSCNFTSTGGFDADAVTLNRSNSTTIVDNVIFRNCTTSCTRRGLNLPGITNVIIDKCNIQCVSTVNSLHALILGVDGPQSGTTYATTGTITNSTFATLNGHGALLGAGITSCTFVGNKVIGGNSLTSGQGLIAKEGTNITCTDNLVYGGYSSGIYIKGAQSAVFSRNTIINLYPTSSAIRIDKNLTDPGATYSGATVTDNYVIAQTGTMFAIDINGTGETGTTSVLDRNTYDLQGSATWGTIKATTVASLAAAQAVWSSYGGGANEANSNQGAASPAIAYRHTATVGTTPAVTFTGPAIYRLIYDLFGNIWNGTTFTPYVTGNHYAYANWLIEATPGSYRYATKIPMLLPAGDYLVETLLTTNLTATPGNTKLQVEAISWDGTNRIREQYLSFQSTQIRGQLIA